MTMPDLILLCGGMGTRLRSVVSDTPKPMARVAGRPFLEILLSHFAELGFARAVLSTGYMAEKISDHFGPRFQGIDLSYCVEPEPLGTGGASRAAARMCATDTVLVCNGDTFLEFDFESVRAFNLDRQEKASVAVTLGVPDTERYGRIEIGPDAQARFAGRGRPGAGFISGGVYLLPRADLLAEARPAPFSLEDFVFDSARGGRIFAVPAHGRFIDIGVPEDYAAAQAMFANEQARRA